MEERNEMEPMDQLKIGTEFMKGFLSGKISDILEKKLGFHIDVHINGAEAVNKDGKVKVYLDMDAETSVGELQNILEHIGKTDDENG